MWTGAPAVLVMNFRDLVQWKNKIFHSPVVGKLVVKKFSWQPRCALVAVAVVEKSK